MCIIQYRVFESKKKKVLVARMMDETVCMCICLATFKAAMYLYVEIVGSVESVESYRGLKK